MDDAISVEIKWKEDGGRCLEVSKSLASIHFQAMGEREVGGEPLPSHKKVTDWAPRWEVLGFTLNTEAMTVSLPLQKLRDLQERLEAWSTTRETATVREILVLAGKLDHAAFVVWPGRFSVRKLLQLSMLHVN